MRVYLGRLKADQLPSKGFLFLAAAVWVTGIMAPLAWGQGGADITYKIYCSRCHGDTGHGDGADAATLKTRPRNFTDCTGMAKISDETMFRAIDEGGAAVGLPEDMPSWDGVLSVDDIHAVMKYIHHFCQK